MITKLETGHIVEVDTGKKIQYGVVNQPTWMDSKACLLVLASDIDSVVPLNVALSEEPRVIRVWDAYPNFYLLNPSFLKRMLKNYGDADTLFGKSVWSSTLIYERASRHTVTATVTVEALTKDRAMNILMSVLDSAEDILRVDNIV